MHRFRRRILRFACTLPIVPAGTRVDLGMCAPRTSLPAAPRSTKPEFKKD